MRFVEDVLDRYGDDAGTVVPPRKAGRDITKGKFEQFLAAVPLSDDEDSSDEEV